jgi:hypothetical protein
LLERIRCHRDTSRQKSLALPKALCAISGKARRRWVEKVRHMSLKVPSCILHLMPQVTLRARISLLMEATLFHRRSGTKVAQNEEALGNVRVSYTPDPPVRKLQPRCRAGGILVSFNPSNPKIIPINPSQSPPSILLSSPLRIQSVRISYPYNYKPIPKEFKAILGFASMHLDFCPAPSIYRQRSQMGKYAYSTARGYM